MRVVARGEQVPLRPGAVEDQGRPGAAGHDPARRAAGGQRLQRAADPVPAALRAEDPRAARRHRGPRPDAGARGGRGPRRWAGLPGHHRRLHGRRPLGVGPDRGRSRAGSRRSRYSASSIRPLWTKSWRGSLARPRLSSWASHRVQLVNVAAGPRLARWRPYLVHATLDTLRPDHGGGAVVGAAHAHQVDEFKVNDKWAAMIAP